MTKPEPSPVATRAAEQAIGPNAPEGERLSMRDIVDVLNGAAYDHAFVEAALTEMKALRERLGEEHRLRYLLWVRHGHTSLYGDDGEMQCSTCRVDFKRDPVQRIMGRFAEIGRAALAAKQDGPDA